MTDQDHRMHAILLRLELLSHGATQAWNASGGHSGEPDDRMIAIVTQHEDPPHLHYRRRYQGAKSDGGREAVIEAAGEELRAWTTRTAPLTAPTETLDQVILVDGEGWEAELVARQFRVDPAFVRRIRQRAGRGTEDGRPVTPVVSADVAEKRMRARELKNRGLSMRQIALHLGCGVGTAHRYLNDSRAVPSDMPLESGGTLAGA